MSKGCCFQGHYPLALSQLASAQIYCGDTQGAFKSAREALAVRMIYLPTLINMLAIAHRDGGELDLSISIAREATRLDPAHSDSYVNSMYRLCSLRY